MEGRHTKDTEVLAPVDAIEEEQQIEQEIEEQEIIQDINEENMEEGAYITDAETIGDNKD